MDYADSHGLLTTNWHELPRNGRRGPGAACGRNQIRSTESEILNPQDGLRHKFELPKRKIQNKPQRLISTVVMAAGFQYQAEKKEVETL